MELNATKCKTMHISRKRAPTWTQYSINENSSKGYIYLCFLVGVGEFFYFIIE
jgi:hypothetical protein